MICKGKLGCWAELVVQSWCRNLHRTFLIEEKIRPSAGMVYSYNVVVETFSRVHCVELGRPRRLEDPIKEMGL